MTLEQLNIVFQLVGTLGVIGSLIFVGLQFCLAEAQGKLLRLPTGDGGALVFRTSPEASLRRALEIG